MPLQPGTRFDAYTIVSLIGAGGMGEVYRAREDRLDRDVAIKVLPQAFADHPDRLQRFQREARVLASLSHPNIVQIFGSGEREGAPYLVMELLEGDTLADRLQEGKPLPPRRAAELAREAALGLAAAHEHGILHRDLKPANLFLTRDGRVKVLDFGLAKSLPPAGPSGALTFSTTLSEPGRVLGTSGYMSPEQVRGAAVDARSDLFSLGVVLWELVTGRGPFQRRGVVETLNAILTEDPPDLDPALKVPPALERIILSCLAKDPEGRFHSAHDLAFALGGLGDRSLDGELNVPPARPIRRWVPALLPLAGAAVALAALGVARLRQWPPFRPPAAPVFRQLTFREGRISAARFAPDGREVLLSADWASRGTFELYSLRLSPRELKPSGIRDVLLHAVSPGGEILMAQGLTSYAWWTWRGGLGRARLEAPVPRAFEPHVLSADLSSRGVLALSRQTGTSPFRLECPAGQVRLDNGSDVTDLRFSADGTRLAYIEHPHSGDSFGQVGLLDLATGRTRTLTERFQSAIGLAWHGDEVWFTAADQGPLKALWAVSTSGRIRLVHRSPADLTLLDAAPDGRLLLASEQFASRLYVATAGLPEPRELTKGRYPVPVGLTADGTRLLYLDQTDATGLSYPLYLQPLPEGPAQHLGETGAYAALSPDGRRVVAFQGTPMHPVIIPLGPGEVRHLPSHGLEDYPVFNYWTPDGRSLVLTAKPRGGTQLRTYLQDAERGDLQPLGPEGTVLTRPAPDGQRFLARVGGQQVILDRRKPEVPGAPVRGFQPGEQVLGWAPDGARLLICRASPGAIQVFRLDPASGHRTPWVRFETPGLHVRRFGAPSRLSADGRTLVFSNHTWVSTLFVVEGL